MTRRDILIHVLSEVTGRSPELVGLTLAAATVPTAHADEEVPDPEAKALIEALLKERSGILNWLIEGAKGWPVRSEARP